MPRKLAELPASRWRGAVTRHPAAGENSTRVSPDCSAERDVDACGTWYPVFAQAVRMLGDLSLQLLTTSVDGPGGEFVVGLLGPRVEIATQAAEDASKRLVACSGIFAQAACHAAQGEQQLIAMNSTILSALARDSELVGRAVQLNHRLDSMIAQLVERLECVG